MFHKLYANKEDNSIMRGVSWFDTRHGLAKEYDTYFSYRTISGSQTFFGATLIVVNPPNSLLFHASSGLFHI